MKNKFLCGFAFISSVLSFSAFAIDSYKPSLYESEDGVKAYILEYESDTNAFLVKMTGTKTILDDTVIEVGRNEVYEGHETLDTLMYGGSAKLFNINDDTFPQKLEFINPDNTKKILLSYDKLDTDDSKYSDKDMLKEFKTQKNKDKFSLIKKFDREKLEHKFELVADDLSKQIGDTCKTKPIPIKIDWSQIGDKEMETWKTYYCMGNADTIDTYCRSNDENRKVVQNNINSFSCHPVKYTNKKQYIELKDNELKFYYTENTENVDDFMRDFLTNQHFTK